MNHRRPEAAQAEYDRRLADARLGAVIVFTIWALIALAATLL